MNLGDAFRYPFSDDGWLGKLTIATILLFIPIVGWLIIMGYGLRVIRRVINGNDQLPEWVNFSRDFNNGLMVFLGLMIYGIPIFIFLCMTLVLYELLGAELSIILSCCGSFLLFIYSIIIAPVTYSAVAQYSISRDFADFLDFSGHIQDATSYASEMISLILMSILVWILMGIPTGLAFSVLFLLFNSPLLAVFCLILFVAIGPFTLAITSLIGCHVAGQWGRVIGAHRQRDYR